MRCVICNRADVEPGTITVTLERGGRAMITKDIAARVCPFCGEEYLDEDAAARLLETAEQAA